jgi:nitrite reductase/ring-hydroxylating ferredoxin subunit
VPTGLSLHDLADGSATPAEVDGARVLLIRLGEEVRAVSAVCTHQGSLIGAQQVATDGLIECPTHGAVFDTADGTLQLGPTCDAIPVYRVRVGADGAIAVAVMIGEPDPSEQRASSFGVWGAARSWPTTWRGIAT